MDYISLIEKPQTIVLAKMDSADKPLTRKMLSLSFGKRIPVVPISAVSGEGAERFAGRSVKKTDWPQACISVKVIVRFSSAADVAQK